MKSKTLKLMFVDAIASAVVLCFAFLIRFDFIIPQNFLVLLYNWLPWFIIIQITIFYFSGLYARIWRFTSLFDLYAILSSVTIVCAISVIFVFIVYGSTGYPRSVLLIYYILNGITTVALRLSVRVYFTHYYDNPHLKDRKPKKVLLLIGAGKTADKITREIMSTSRHQYSIIGFVDDDAKKHGALLHGKKIYCSIGKLLDLKVDYDELLITAPSASGDQVRRIVDICKQTGKRYKTVPAINEIIDGEISIATIRDVSYSDLLGREEVFLDMNSIEGLIKGKRILITGAGGSIGSELIKQCLVFNPAEIICLDTSEENIYKLDQFFSKVQSQTILKTVLASINIKNECDKVFSENRPHIVFHAAAYKHVPIQELHPWTAVKTNIAGTLNIVELSDQYLVDKFVLVSTDKAVNPINVMGATKRVAELVVQSFNLSSKTTFMAVRFGNVLGSSGSAIPTFQKQINEGGPITITHPEMTRYFMSMQEASQLILQCGALGRDGEIFLLEMGKPIRILQMAKDLIRLSGFEPDIDIPIVFTGLRLGEKLYEELQLLDEKKISTAHKKIMILKGSIPPLPWLVLKQSIIKVIDASQNLESEKIQILLKNILPNYVPKMFNSTSQVKVNKKKMMTGIKANA